MSIDKKLYLKICTTWVQKWKNVLCFIVFLDLFSLPEAIVWEKERKRVHQNLGHIIYTQTFLISIYIRLKMKFFLSHSKFLPSLAVIFDIKVDLVKTQLKNIQMFKHLKPFKQQIARKPSSVKIQFCSNQNWILRYATLS